MDPQKVAALGVLTVLVAVVGGAAGTSGFAAEAPAADASPAAPVSVVAGTSEVGDGELATDAWLAGIGDLAVDHAGNLYVSDVAHNRVRRVDAKSGRITTILGDGSVHLRQEAEAATETGMLSPWPLAISPDGDSLYVTQSLGGTLHRVDLESGELTDLGAPAYGLGQVTDLLVTGDGTVYVGDALYGQIYRFREGRWEGLLSYSEVIRGGMRRIVQDGDGNLYVSAFFGHQVFRWDAETETMEPYVGTGTPGRSGEGELAAESLIGTPDGLALDAEGNLYVADMGNNRIFRVERETGRLWTVRHSPEEEDPQSWTPSALVRDGKGRIWIGDIRHNRVLRFDPDAGEPVVEVGGAPIGDGGPAVEAVLAHPGRIAVGSGGDLFISEALHHRVRRVDARTGRISTVAGTGIPGYNGDGIPGPEAQLNHPGGVLAVGEDRLYIADYYNNRVRMLDLESGVISTVAGSGLAGEEGDGGPARQAWLINPHALTLAGKDRLLVTSAVTSSVRAIDLAAGRIDAVPLDRRVVPEGEVRIFYGIAWADGGFYLADGMRDAVLRVEGDRVREVVPPDSLRYPMDVAVSPKGTLYICDTRNNRVVRWNGETVEVVAEDLGRPRSIAFGPRGGLFIADTFNNRVLRVDVAEAEGGGPEVGSSERHGR
ncbi:MAG: NHL repeat-containing protein [Acidobacteriota bacterium]|jgi:sugar lactone lactonase YvrE